MHLEVVITIIYTTISMPPPNYPVLCFPLPYRAAPVFVKVVCPPLGWSPLSYFRVVWSPRGETRGPSAVFEAADVLYPGPFHFCPLPVPDVGRSVLVCDVEHISFNAMSRNTIQQNIRKRTTRNITMVSTVLDLHHHRVIHPCTVSFTTVQMS